MSNGLNEEDTLMRKNMQYMPNFGQEASLKATTWSKQDQGKIILLKWIINKLLTSYKIRMNGHILKTDKTNCQRMFWTQN